MTIAGLIERLSKYDQNLKVMILDGFNGGGAPRDLNLGPHRMKIAEEHAEETADCEDRVGETIVVLGYGCY